MREAITPARMTEVRKKVKIGDKIIIVPVKCGEGEQKGTVVGIYRSFATVKLKNGICESVSWLEAMERDYAECQKMMKRGEDYDCDRCSWANVSIYGTGACELKGLKEQLGGISGETDGKER